jgi:signal transduction histidine kinase
MLHRAKLPFQLNLRKRIQASFALLVLLFVINGIITILTINSINKLSNRLSDTIDPSLETLDNFKKIMLESKMYTTNWVFLRSNQQDKRSLEKLHQKDYPAMKARMTGYASHWSNKNWRDSLSNLFRSFEELLVIEKKIMSSLKKFEDYDDPVIRLEAERQIEEEILPRTALLIRSLEAVEVFGVSIKARENSTLERSSMKLRLFIIILAITIVCAGFLLSGYMTRIIIRPVKKIRLLVNDLGKGITRPIDQPVNNDEIGEMISSVKNLSEKLSLTATFANEIGNRNFNTWYEPLSPEDTLGKALITMRDNLRKSEMSLAVNTEELERKNKELEQFAYIASHDLQEPLRTTFSFVELLQTQYYGKLDAKADKYLTYILQSSDRMKVLINDLLDYSRIGNKKELQKVDCNIILQEVLDDMGKTIKDQNACIRSEYLPVIKGYRTEIKQLFQNLIANAIKFRKKDTCPEVRITVTEDQSSWNFAISDNGIGIAEDHKDRIFIIFQRLHTRSEYEGSGIGLAHCQKIVALHGGKIWVNSLPGQGATFHFQIPKLNNQ